MWMCETPEHFVPLDIGVMPAPLLFVLFALGDVDRKWLVVPLDSVPMAPVAPSDLTLVC